MTIENKKTSYQLIFVHIFRKKYFKDNLENFMSESLNATSTPLKTIEFFDLKNSVKPVGYPFRAKFADI
jgi:hypothetical protein